MPASATRLDAVQNINGTVDILIDGRHIDGGDDLPVADVVSMLGAYARVNGALLVTTRLLDGRTTTDRVDQDGTMSPYYAPEARAQPGNETRAPADPSVLFKAMAEQPAGPVIDPTPVWPEARSQAVFASRTASKIPTVGEVPQFDVEGDILRDLAAAAAPAKRPKSNLLPIVGTIGAIVAAGALLFLILPQLL